MSSIPLPAMGTRPAPDPSEGMQRMIALKGMLAQQAQQQALMPGQLQAQQQQLQAGQLENATRAQQLKDQQAMTAAMQEWDGKNPDTLPGIMLKKGASAQAVMSMRSSNLDYKKKLLDTDKADLENQGAVTDKLIGHLDAIKAGANPQDQAGQIIAGGLHKYLDPQSQQMIQAVASGQMTPNPEQLSIFEKGLTGHKAQIEDTLKQAETSKNIEQAGQAKANTAKLQAELNFYQKKGLAPGVPMDAQEAADWLDKNPGKGPADFMKMKAALVPAINFNLQNQGTATAPGGNVADTAKRFGYSPVAFDQAAEKYWSTGQLPPSGRGGPALAANKAIQNRAAELHPEGALAANSAEYHANAESLKGLQKNLDAVSAFENTAKKNLDLLIEQGQKVIDSGSPWINTPLRAVGQQGLGSTDLAALNAARQVAVNEVAKVTSSPGLSGQLSDTARKEIEAFLPQSATLAQTVRVAKILKQDMANRHQSYQDQINDIKGRLGGGTRQSSSQSQSGGQVAPEGTIVDVNGKKQIKRNGQWVPM